MDVFKEQLIAVKKNKKTTLKKTGLIAVGIVVAVVAMLFGGSFIGPVVVVALFFGGNYLLGSMNLEYEYILTNNELDVDKIMNKERRKRYFTIDLKEINIMAHIDDAVRKPEVDRAQKTIDVSSGEKGPNTYAIVFSHKNELTKVIIEPNEDMKKVIFRQAPSKVFL
ncbi:MAG TPA: hypothetical protein GX707_01470 [Epulopiscium sp.]|nr:hypothetical protein [Candidatus Epulonipiscium sp.]